MKANTRGAGEAQIFCQCLQKVGFKFHELSSQLSDNKIDTLAVLKLKKLNYEFPFYFVYLL